MNKASCIIIALSALISGTFAVCAPGFSEVGDKCYTVPGLPQRYDFWSSNELCSVAKSNLFHVETLTQWEELNTFLVGLGYYDTYWTGVAAEGHPGLWVVRSTGYELNLAAVEFKAGAPSNSATNLCLAIEYQTELGRYQWVDYPCTDPYVIVCEPRVCLANNKKF
ncbi:perlucin-like [Daphnia magna]|uniref:C-type lectin domain-containing protein n=2 Tax=Daphnia magna TaxID=35525 RepID=A0A0N8D9R5_9CRUS|nr:perlucin [Daphnia magna]XP_045028740.1 perlucin-like [Daphnia magna]KAK4011405.1 hypothetical protein OUZ56_020522 [Daphnia magna]KZS11513.1 Uncharacterized protein APZ42_024306 [Daphnia magna]